MRIIRENCLFLDSELELDSTISTNSFISFINSNSLKFDDVAGAFLVTFLEDRTVDYDLKRLDSFEIARLDSTSWATYPEWYYRNQIDGFLATKNPEALKWIASAWFQQRSRFNRYSFDDEYFLELIKKLTRVDLGVRDESGRITFLYKDDYSSKARLNYLIYWVKHYQDYEWNQEKGVFENVKTRAGEKSREETQFRLLSSEDDSTAIAAFIQLTEMDRTLVESLAIEYSRNHIDYNYSLPTFPYRFLEQAVLLVDFCRSNGFTYNADGWLRDSLEKLKADLHYNTRYQLENFIINNLSLKDVTSVEYYGLIYGRQWDVSYSLGRILDKFYSLEWQALIVDKKQVMLYLKKAALFDNLGIIGICRKYKRKFENCNREDINRLREWSQQTQDKHIIAQLMEILRRYPKAKTISRKVKLWAGNNNEYGVNNLKQKYEAIRSSKLDLDSQETAMQELFGKISYHQLGQTIRIFIEDTLSKPYEKFHLLESDFGFNIKISDSSEIRIFLDRHSTLSEKQVYDIYLKELGLRCFNNTGELDMHSVYEILKFDIVDAFVGGGGGRRDNGVYLIIKLLEFKFNTSLGFPKKLCSWQGRYRCEADDRAKAWMKFLEEKGFVKPDTNEPPSISFND